MSYCRNNHKITKSKIARVEISARADKDIFTARYVCFENRIRSVEGTELQFLVRRVDDLNSTTA